MGMDGADPGHAALQPGAISAAPGPAPCTIPRSPKCASVQYLLPPCIPLHAALLHPASPPCTTNSSLCNDPVVLHCLPALRLSMQHPLNAQIPLHAMSYTPPHAAPLCFASVQHSLQPLIPLHASTKGPTSLHLTTLHPAAPLHSSASNLPIHHLLHPHNYPRNVPSPCSTLCMQHPMHPPILLHPTSQWSCTLHPFTSLHPGTPLLGLFVQRPVHPKIYLHAKSQ